MSNDPCGRSVQPQGCGPKMCEKELCRIRTDLGLKQADIAALGQTTMRTVQHWCGGGEVRNGFAILALRLLHRHPELLPEAWEIIGQPGGRSARPRGRPRKKNNTKKNRETPAMTVIINAPEKALKAIEELVPGGSFTLPFDDVDKVFPPGMNNGCVDPETLKSMQRFAGRTNCHVTRDDLQKAYVFTKSTDDVG